MFNTFETLAEPRKVGCIRSFESNEKSMSVLKRYREAQNRPHPCGQASKGSRHISSFVQHLDGLHVFHMAFCRRGRNRSCILPGFKHAKRTTERERANDVEGKIVEPWESIQRGERVGVGGDHCIPSGDEEVKGLVYV